MGELTTEPCGRDNLSVYQATHSAPGSTCQLARDFTSVWLRMMHMLPFLVSGANRGARAGCEVEITLLIIKVALKNVLQPADRRCQARAAWERAWILEVRWVRSWLGSAGGSISVCLPKVQLD